MASMSPRVAAYSLALAAGVTTARCNSGRAFSASVGVGVQGRGNFQRSDAVGLLLREKAGAPLDDVEHAGSGHRAAFDEMAHGVEARLSPTGLGKPFHVNVAPKEAGDVGKRFRGIRPRGGELGNIGPGKAGGDESLERVRRQVGLVGEAAPEREGEPLLLHHGLARAAGVFGQEIAAPEVAVRAHVEAGDLVRAGYGLDEGAGIVQVRPAEAVDVVVPHGEPGAELGTEQRQHRFDHARLGHRIHVGDGVFEAEVERAGQFGELVLDVAQPGHVEAVDEPEFPLGGRPSAHRECLRRRSSRAISPWSSRRCPRACSRRR